MRPEILYSLFAPLTSLSGIGARYLKLYTNLLGGDKVIDLLMHFPSGLIDRSNVVNLSTARPDTIATLTVEVAEHIAPHSKKSPYKVVCRDAYDEITLVFFHAYKDYLLKALPVGEPRIISGRIEKFGKQWQMTHPDYIVSPSQQEDMPIKEPVYPLTAGLSGKMLIKSVNSALSKIPSLPEWLDNNLLRQENWHAWDTSLKAVHTPQHPSDVEASNHFRRRLAYDELLANQLALALTRAKQKKLGGMVMKGNAEKRKRVLAALPFKLTEAQKRVIREINADMAEPTRMLRLLQGDVGSGKTIVAFFALLNAIECGHQGAFMAPTDILARQHYSRLKPLAELAGVNIALLTGKDKASQKQSVVNELAAGKIDIAVGTHALFQDKVEFSSLGLVVIDEQHRFGVEQRLALTDKGKSPDVLVMTATPIPRTLVLGIYGDMDVSCIDELPPSRQPVITTILPHSRIKEVLAAVKRALDAGAKVYWICPLVEESEVSDLAAAEERYKRLAELFKDKVALVHGRLKSDEKEAAMNEFAHGSKDLLVATTVVEVGVDVPAATVMVIEHAERFGLAQLHQLRGRIGRGDKASNCLLVYSLPLSANAKARLKIMRETEDGFKIAEEDLRLRGFGEVLGTRQSGMPDFKIADLFADSDLFHIAAQDAKIIMATDAELASPRGKALRTLLYLFGEDEACRTLRAG